MKLLSPGGLIVIAIIVAIIFLPRRLPDAAKKIRKPMRAFPDEPSSPEDAEAKSSDKPQQP
ncbi:MAG: twin-arginine translocase TatA/TatE family subunit [Coriobacteriia bacterium]|nr:twin-arginine translocase TatA/TatE family subunit [Coriobacteriia bacterium]